MTARLNPYLSFAGDARAAMEHYGSVFGGRPTIMTFADSGGMGMPEDQQHLVMHGELVVRDDLTLMGADSPQAGDTPPSNGTLCLNGDDDAVLRGWWDALSADGTITLPLEVAPWGDAYGQVTDRFGVSWMFNIGSATSQE
jgi:PhnB protein